MMRNKYTRMTTKNFSVLCAIWTCFACNSQSDPQVEPKEEIQSSAPQIQWHKGYGTPQEEHIHEVMQTLDGGFLGIGQTAETIEEKRRYIADKNGRKWGLFMAKNNREPQCS